MINNEDLKTGYSRRTFLSRMALGGVAVAGLISGCGDSGNDLMQVSGQQGNVGNNQPSPTPSPTNTPGFPDPVNFPGIPGETLDVAVLNFALTLEFLEADLYRQALNFASGRSLDTPLDPNPNSYTQTIPDGNLGTRADAGFVYLQQYAYVEKAHVDFLLAAIPSFGGTPVGPNPGGYQADLGTNLQTVLTTIRTLEEEGVRAYLGAAGYLSTLPLIQTAGTIYSTEARHSAALNYVLGLPIGPQKMTGDMMVVPNYPSENTFEYFRTPTQVINDIQPFLV